MKRADLTEYGHAPDRVELSLLRCIVLGEALPRPVIELVVEARAADAGIARLLPALRGHPDLGRLPGAARDRIAAGHRQSTCRYLALKASLSLLLPRLAAGGVEVLLLKGFPLATLYYQSVGARPMVDLDLAVRPAQFEPARRVLERAGFMTTPEHRAAAPGPGGHAVAFRNGEGLEIDLHTHILRASRWHGADDAFWSGALPFAVREHAALTLCAADHLLQTCVHGPPWNLVSPIRWVVDAAAILERGAIDWPRLVEQVARHDCAGPVLACLGYLRDQFGLPIPAGRLDELGRRPDSEASERYFRLVAPGPASRGGPRHWLARLAADRARQARGEAAAGGRAPGLLTLAASKLEITRWRDLPIVWRRLRRVARRRPGLRRPRVFDPR
jgi:Uncharacterised nucleotidyltransferase